MSKAKRYTTEMEDKNAAMKFEEWFCAQNPEVWLAEASQLFESAKILFHFSCVHTEWLFDRTSGKLADFPSDLLLRTAINPRIIRMLWAYGFENILKGIRIAKLGIKSVDQEEMKRHKLFTHNLINLYRDCEIPLSEDDIFHVKAWQKCAEWMGRYPIPQNAQQLSERRVGAESSEILIQRTQERIALLKAGKIPRIHCEADLLSGGISKIELDAFERLSELGFIEFEKALKQLRVLPPKPQHR